MSRFSGAFALLALLACSVFAQPAGIRVILNDDTIIDQIGFGTKKVGHVELSVKLIQDGHLRARVRNCGKPEWVRGGPATGDRVFIKAAAVGTPPGWNIEWAEQLFAWPAFEWGGMSVWSVLGPGDRHATHPRVPEAATWHFLEGGESFAWDIVQRPLMPPKGSKYEQLARELLYMLPAGEEQKEAEIAKQFPRRARLSSLYRITRSSFTYGSQDHDLGWWMNWQHQRFTQGRVPQSHGPTDWGGIVGAEGHTNGMYDAVAWCVENWLTTRDPGAWNMARLHGLQRVAHGFVWSDVDVPRITHRWRYEKSSFGGHWGDYRFPEPSHEMDRGMYLLAILSQDPDLLQVMRFRGEALLNEPHPWNRYWGVRQLAWHIECLWVHWIVTGDERFRNEAEEKIRYAFSRLRPDELWFPNDGMPPSQAETWQGAVMLAWTVQWITGAGICPELNGRVYRMSQWLIDNTTKVVETPIGPCLLTKYQYDTETGKTVWGSLSQASMYIPLLYAATLTERDTYLPLLKAAVNSGAGGAFQLLSSVSPELDPKLAQMDCPSYGYGATKIEGNIMWGNRPLFLLAAMK